MTSLSSIPLPRAKSSPFHTFPLPQKKHGGHKITLARSPAARLACYQSSTVFRCSWNTLQHALLPDPQHIALTRKASIFPSSTSCIIHEATKIFSRGSTAPNPPQIYTSLNPLRFSATSMLQHPSGHRQSHAAQVPGKQTALDLAPGSIWTRSTTFTSSAQNSAIVHSETQNIPHFFEGCYWLTGIRT